MKPSVFSWAAVTKDTTGANLASPPSYKVYAAPIGQSYGAALATTTDTSVSVAMPSVGIYKGAVAAVTPDGEGPKSMDVTFEAVLQIPAAPTNFTVS